MSMAGSMGVAPLHNEALAIRKLVKTCLGALEPGLEVRHFRQHRNGMCSIDEAGVTGVLGEPSHRAMT